MNKKTLLSIAATLLLLSNRVAAAENPFADIPADHWSRSAIEQLADDGLLKGYDDNIFHGENAITRYEMAQWIARVLAKEAAISAKDQTLLDKLSKEYAPELMNLGVRIATLENKTDSVKINGYAYLRIQHQTIKDTVSGTRINSSLSKFYQEAVIAGKVNDRWDAVSQIQINKDLRSDKDADNDFLVKGLSVNGTLGTTKVKLGKFEQSTQEAIIFHEYTSGAEITFGKALKTRLTLGQVSNAMNLIGETKNRVSYKAAEFNYDLNKSTQLNAAYFSLNGDELAYTRGNRSPSIYSLGFSKKLDSNWQLAGFYSKASSDIAKGHPAENTGEMINLSYKGAKLNCPDSFGIYLKYIQLPKLNQIFTDVAHQYNYKGFELGTMYMLAPNMRGHLRYYRGEDVDNSHKKKDLVRAEVRIFF